MDQLGAVGTPAVNTEKQGEATTPTAKKRKKKKTHPSQQHLPSSTSTAVACTGSGVLSDRQVSRSDQASANTVSQLVLTSANILKTCRSSWKEEKVEDVVTAIKGFPRLPKNVTAKAKALINNLHGVIAGPQPVDEKTYKKLKEQCVTLLKQYTDNNQYPEARLSMAATLWWCLVCIDDEASAIEALQALDNAQLCKVDSVIIDHPMLKGEMPSVVMRRNLVLRHSAEHGNTQALEELIQKCLFDEKGFSTGFSLEEGFRWVKTWRDMVQESLLPAPEGQDVIARLVRWGRDFNKALDETADVPKDHRLIECGLWLDHRFGQPDTQKSQELLSTFFKQSDKVGRQNKLQTASDLSQRQSSIAWLWKGMLSQPSLYRSDSYVEEQQAEECFKNAKRLGSSDGLIQYGWLLLRMKSKDCTADIEGLFQEVCHMAPESQPLDVWCLLSRFSGRMRPTRVDRILNNPRGQGYKKQHQTNAGSVTVDSYALRGIEKAMYHGLPIARSLWLSKRLIPIYRAYYERHYKAGEEPEASEEECRQGDVAKNVLRLFQHIKVDADLLVYQSFWNGEPQKISRNQDTSELDATLARSLRIDPVHSSILILSLYQETQAYSRMRLVEPLFESLVQWNMSQIQALLSCNEFKITLLNSSGALKRHISYEEIMWKLGFGSNWCNNILTTIQELYLTAGEVNKAKKLCTRSTVKNKIKPALSLRDIERGAYTYHANLPDYLDDDQIVFPMTPIGVAGVVSHTKSLEDALSTSYYQNSPHALYTVVFWAKVVLLDLSHLLKKEEVQQLVDLAGKAHQIYLQASKRAEKVLVGRVRELALKQCPPLPIEALDALVPAGDKPLLSSANPDDCRMVLNYQDPHVRTASLRDPNNIPMEELHTLLDDLESSQWGLNNSNFAVSDLCHLVLTICERLDGNDKAYSESQALCALLVRLVQHLICSSQLRYKRILLEMIENLEFACTFRSACFKQKQSFLRLVRSTCGRNACSFKGGDFSHANSKLDPGYQAFYNTCLRIENVNLVFAYNLLYDNELHDFMGYVQDCQSQKYTDSELDLMMPDEENSKESDVKIRDKVCDKCLRGKYDDELWKCLTSFPINSPKSLYPLALVLVTTEVAYKDKWSDADIEQMFGKLNKSKCPDLYFYEYLWRTRRGEQSENEALRCLMNGDVAGSDICRLELAKLYRCRGNEKAAEARLQKVGESSGVYGEALYLQAEIALQKATEDSSADCHQAYLYFSKASRYHHPLALVRLFTCLYPLANALWNDNRELELKDRCFIRECLERAAPEETPGRSVCWQLLEHWEVGEHDAESLQSSVDNLSIAEVLVFAQLPESFWPPVQDKQGYREQLIERIVTHVTNLPPKHSRELVEGIAIKQLSWYPELSARLIDPNAQEAINSDDIPPPESVDFSPESDDMPPEEHSLPAVDSQLTMPSQSAEDSFDLYKPDSVEAFLNSSGSKNSQTYIDNMMTLFNMHGENIPQVIKGASHRKHCIKILFDKGEYQSALKLLKAMANPQKLPGQLWLYLHNACIKKDRKMIVTLLEVMLREPEGCSGPSIQEKHIQKVINTLFSDNSERVKLGLSSEFLEMVSSTWPDLVKQGLIKAVTCGQTQHLPKVLVQCQELEKLLPEIKSFSESDFGALFTAACNSSYQIAQKLILHHPQWAFKCLSSDSLPEQLTSHTRDLLLVDIWKTKQPNSKDVLKALADLRSQIELKLTSFDQNKVRLKERIARYLRDENLIGLHACKVRLLELEPQIEHLEKEYYKEFEGDIKRLSEKLSSSSGTGYQVCLQRRYLEITKEKQTIK